MRRFQVRFILLILLLGSMSTTAQINTIRFDYILNPQTELSGNEKYGYSIYDLIIDHTLFSKTDPNDGTFTILLGSLEIRYQHLSYAYTGEDVFAQLIADEFPGDLYAARYDLTIMRSVSDKWYLVTKANAGLYSDLKNISLSHFLLEGGVIPVLQFEGFDVGVGPFYTYAFGNPRIIPAPFIRFKGESVSRIMFSVAPPLNARLGYRFTDGFNSGISLKTIRNNYEIGDTFFPGDPVFIFSDLTLGPDFNYMFSNKISMTLTGGYTIRREFEIKESGSSLGSSGLENAFIINAGITATF